MSARQTYDIPFPERNAAVWQPPVLTQRLCESSRRIHLHRLRQNDYPSGHLVMRLAFCFSLLLISVWAAAQNCSTYALAAPFDKKTGDDVANLQPENFEAKMGQTILPVLSSTQDFDNRVLVLLETDGADSERIGDVVDLVVKLARQAPDGKRIAFGI